MSTLKNRVGERRQMSNGEWATITCYNGCKDCTVVFDDGTVREHMSYDSFKNGVISKNGKSGNFIDRTGERKQMSNGEWVTVIRYGGWGDCDFRFDNGVVKHGKKYRGFSDGTLSSLSREGQTSQECKEKYIGTKWKQKCGKTAEIIDYFDWNNCTVRFDDGTLKTGVKVGRLKEGKVGYGSKRKLRTSDMLMGSSKRMNCGLTAQIVGFTKSKSGVKKCVLQFENGERTSVTMPSYDAGTVLPPSMKPSSKVGKVFVADNGFKVRVVSWAGNGKYLFEFQDGKRNTGELKCNLAHVARPIEVGTYRYTLYNYRYNKYYAYDLGDKRYFKCEDKNGVRDVLTLEEMMVKSGIKLLF